MDYTRTRSDLEDTREEEGQPELTEEEKTYLPFAWRLLSGSDEARLSVQNLGRILRGFGKNPSDQEVQFLLYDHRLNKKQTLGYDEVVPLYMKCKTEVCTVSQLLAAFRVFDPDETGKITMDDLRDILTRLGEALTSDEFEQLSKKADPTGDGVIVYKDFCKLVMGDNRPLL